MRIQIRSLYGNTTFPSFVSYLLDHHQRENSVSNMDVHLRPQIEGCGYCRINYTFVATFERFEEGMQIILSAAGVKEPAELLEEVTLRCNPKRTSKKTLKVKAMYSLLNLSLRLRLKDLYFLDFELFGYDPNKFD